MVSREESGANKIADIFSDDRLNVVQLAYHTSLGFTPRTVEKIRGWLHWHDHISERIQVTNEGGTEFIDGEYLEYIKR